MSMITGLCWFPVLKVEIGSRKAEGGMAQERTSPTSHFSHFSDFPLPTSHFPLPISHFRLPTSNLENGGLAKASKVKMIYRLIKKSIVQTAGCFLLFLFLVACGPSGSQINAIDLDNRFVAALYAGNVAAIDSCLAAGVDVNIRDVNEIPAIIIAANSGNVEVAKKLVERGANVNSRSPFYYNSTALMEIAAAGDLNMATFLIANGADVHLRDSFGDPAMNWAAYYGNIPLVDLLVQNGASWDVKSEHGSAIDVAMKQWNDPLLGYFIEKGAGVSLEGQALALVQAVRQSDLEALGKLLDQGASPDQVDELATPILINAASKGNEDMVNLLLQKGANINALNRVGQTALARAAYFRHTHIIPILLDKNADVNLTDDFYQLSPLISAAAGGNADIGKLLIDKGADIDHQEGISGFTPLMMATAYGNEEFIQLLLDAGANPYIKTMDGMTLSDMVSYSNNPRIAQMVQDYLMKQ
ncbi:MAG: ankyrin repeat domain-containing protein [Saprospiraceae bacterium]